MSLKTSVARAETQSALTESDVKPMPKVVRQDRIELPDSAAVLTIGDESFEVINCSPFGVAVYCDRDLSEIKSAENARFTYEGNEIATISLRKVRTDILPNVGYKIAFEIISEPICVEKLQAIQLAQKTIINLAEKWRSVQQVPNAFRFKTLEIRNIFLDLQREIDELEKIVTKPSLEETKIMEEMVIREISEFIKISLEPRIRELASTLMECDDSAVKAAYRHYRDTLGDLIYLCPFSERSNSKPLGYAGDFEMMNLVYRGENLGSSLFAKCLFRYMTTTSAALAVKNRSFYLKDTITKTLNERKNSTSKILSVASGPAREVQLIIPSNDYDFSKIEFHLLDQDLTSLKHAQRKIKELLVKHPKDVKITYLNKSIKRVIVEGLSESSYDLIYSAGLFDYFSDTVAQMAAKRLLDALKPGGRLIIGNFNISNPNQFYMDMALDWNLIYRSEADLVKLFDQPGCTLHIEREPENVNLFCVITKNS